MKKKFTDIVFVTAGAGFIGSNYLNRYVPRCSKRLFVNIDSLTYAGDLANISVSDAANYAFHKVDIRDLALLKKMFKTYRPTGIIHFAAESHVDISITNPGIFFETNVLGTHNLLLLAKEFDVKRFHQISTDEVYGALGPRDPKHREDARLAARNPYSASKAAAEHIVHAYNQTFGLNTVITRSNNAYGPNQDTSKLIPSFLSRLLKGKKVPLYSRGEHIREWIYVDDCVDAIHLVYTKGNAGEVYNIGTGFELTNLALTKKLLALTGRDSSFIARAPDRPGHDFRYAIDTSKLRRQLGWKPRVSFDEGLKRTLTHVKKKH